MDKEKFYKAMVKRFGCVPALTDYSASAKNDIPLNEAFNLIPNDDVVLSREEYENEIKNAQKRAVKEALERLKNKFEHCVGDVYSANRIDEKIDEIAKEMGVDLCEQSEAQRIGACSVREYED